LALLSHMARLGANQPIELRDSLDEIAEGFDVDQFGTAPTKFDAQDLYPLTARYLGAQPLAAVADEVSSAGVADAEAFWAVIRENITTRKDIATWADLFANGAEPVIDDEDQAFVAEAMALLPEGPFDGDSWGNWTKAVKEATGRKGRGLFMPLRKALTGMSHGPDMSAVLPMLQVIKARG
jgi:glutamyl-tRNA synthetase